MSDRYRHRCERCGRWFVRFPKPVSCCVLHSPGTCCHFMEQEVTKKGWPKK